ncbi:AMED_5909 family protein [Saccharothrix sp. BKS2]|uniref:AMED_5909 family protein n=1 Tax=Saccharothrix sp. BKS2 TaxID=3064400 RepID=UPI0039E7526A
MAQPKRPDRWAAARAAMTLKDAHEALGKVMPAPDAELSRWQVFYRVSVEVYARVAEVDRGHHHEALYWAQREREKGEEIARSLAVQSSEDGEGG